MASDIPRVGAIAESQTNSGGFVSFALAILSGFVAFGLVYSANPIFDVPKEFHIRGLGESSERWAAYLQQQYLADQKNAAFFLGSLGALLAGAMATRSDSRWSLLARLGLCVPVGALAGAVAGSVSVLMHSYFDAQGQIELPHSVAIYATMFGLLGAGIGAGIELSLGWPLNHKALVERIAVGLISGAFAGAAYPIVSSLLMPSTNIESLLPKSPVSLAICLGLATGILGVTLPLARRLPKSVGAEI